MDVINEFILRKAEYSDIDLLYRWVNDSVVRDNAFNSDLITYEDHCDWFSKILKDSNIIQFIYEYKGEPIGQLRLNIFNHEAEIDYSIQENKRGVGHGKRMLFMLRELLSREYPEIHMLVAKVKTGNVASVNAFKGAGFDELYECLTLKIK